MNQQPPGNPLYEQVLSRLPQNTRATFTDEQLESLRLVFQQMRWKNNHPIDIRLSIPFPKPGFYIVFLAGQEKRAAKRLRADHPRYYLQAVVFMAIALLIGASILLSGFYVSEKWAAWTTPSPSHPTAIPWLNSEADCKQTNRIWKDSHCWDKNHDPNF